MTKLEIQKLIKWFENQLYRCHGIGDREAWNRVEAFTKILRQEVDDAD